MTSSLRSREAPDARCREYRADLALASSATGGEDGASAYIGQRVASRRSGSAWRLIASGFPAMPLTANGPATITHLSSTVATVNRALPNVTAAGGRSLVVGLPSSFHGRIDLSIVRRVGHTWMNLICRDRHRFSDQAGQFGIARGRASVHSHFIFRREQGSAPTRNT
jgi:hypothetical protein